ncbi:MAG: AzlC family ABC transporter permease [Pontimonas sp.]
MSGDDAELIRAARSQGLQVALAVSLYGVSFGALAVISGFTVAQTMVLSLLMFSGASQFALIGVIASGGASAGFAAVASAGLLGLRNGLYALRMSPIVGPGVVKRFVAAQLTVDESTAVGTAQPTLAANKAGFWTTALLLYAGWNIATLAGALLGDVLGDVRTWGLDAAAAAAFLGLVWPRLRAGEPIAVALGAGFVTALLLPALPAGVPILVVAALTIVLALIRHRQSPTVPSEGEVR